MFGHRTPLAEHEWPGKGAIGQVSADAVLVVGVAIDELKPRMHLEPLR